MVSHGKTLGSQALFGDGAVIQTEGAIAPLAVEVMMVTLSGQLVTCGSADHDRHEHAGINERVDRAIDCSDAQRWIVLAREGVDLRYGQGAFVTGKTGRDHLSLFRVPLQGSSLLCLPFGPLLTLLVTQYQ
jgi:hypothetical protein